MRVLLLAAMLVAAPATAATRYEPVGEWTLSTGGQGCTLIRRFAAGDIPLTMTMQRLHPGHEVYYGLFGPAIARQAAMVEAGFEPATALGGYEQVADAAIAGQKGLLFVGHPFPETTEAPNPGLTPEERQARYDGLLNAAQTFVARNVGKETLRLATGPMAEPLARLDACLDGKLAALGVSEEVRRAAVTSPQAVELDRWAHKIRAVYPPDMLRQGRSADVAVRLIVGPDGRVAHCTSLVRLTASQFNDAACQTMTEHARFAPARDAEGRPVTGLYLTRIRYQIAPAFEVGADGRRVGK